MNAVERAAELGTAHGTAAAHAWCTCPECGRIALTRISSDALPVCRACDWTGWDENGPLPVPDLSDLVLESDAPENVDAMWSVVDAYSAAFTAAVEATVREATSEETYSETCAWCGRSEQDGVHMCYSLGDSGRIENGEPICELCVLRHSGATYESVPVFVAGDSLPRTIVRRALGA